MAEQSSRWWEDDDPDLVRVRALARARAHRLAADVYRFRGADKPLPLAPSRAQIFLPTFSEGSADEVQPNLYLGSEANASDLVWLKVEGITHVLSIQGQPIDVARLPDVSDAMRRWHEHAVRTLFIRLPDSPIASIFEHFEAAAQFINGALDTPGRKVLVHCGRGISRSASLVIAALMRRRGISYADAFALVAAKRPCIYPNVGFQLQLFVYERCHASGDIARAFGGFDAAGELIVSIETTLENIEEQMSQM